MVQAQRTATRTSVKRRRRVGIEAAPKPDPKQVAHLTDEQQAFIEDLISTVAVQNKLMNEHKNAHDKARKALYAKMVELGLKDHKLDGIEFGDDILDAHASVETPESSAIDVAKLRGMVDDEVFMRCISASVTAVTAEAGTNVVNQCRVISKGAENVKVKATKRK